MSSPEKNLFVSIIVITYNRVSMLADALKSILDQSYRHFELIIIDDGSEDNSFELVKSLDDDRIRYFKVEHCGKIGWLRKFGMSKSNGQLIAFNDSDDVWLEGKLEAQVNALLRYPHVGFCLSNGYNEEEPEIKKLFYPKTNGEWTGPLFHACFTNELVCFTQTLVFRKECLEAPLYIPDEKISDRNFIVSLAYHFNGVLLYHPFVKRRIHPGNINLTKWLNSYKNEIELIKHYKSGLPSALYRQALYRTHINFGEACLKKRNKKMAIRQFIKAGKIKPFQTITYKKLVKALIH